jgi:hypothetical protein
MSCRVTPYQRQQWRLQEQQRQEQAAREQRRVADLQNQWAQVSTARPHDLLAAYQRANYYAKLPTLNSIARLINNE